MGVHGSNGGLAAGLPRGPMLEGTEVTLFEDNFHINHLDKYLLQFGDKPGEISGGALIGDSFDYVEVEHPVTPGGRVAMSVYLEHDESGLSNQSLVGASTPDVGSTASFFLRLQLFNGSYNALLAVDAPGLKGFSVSKLGNPPLAGPIWLSCELAANLKSVHGGVWSARPPASGGTPDILALEVVGNATGYIHPAEMYPYIGGTTHQHARYTDWWAMVLTPREPPLSPPIRASGGVAGVARSARVAGANGGSARVPFERPVAG